MWHLKSKSWMYKLPFREKFLPPSLLCHWKSSEFATGSNSCPVKWHTNPDFPPWKMWVHSESWGIPRFLIINWFLLGALCSYTWLGGLFRISVGDLTLYRDKGILSRFCGVTHEGSKDLFMCNSLIVWRTEKLVQTLSLIVVQLLSHIWLFGTSGTTAPLSFTILQRFLQLMSTESMMPSNQLSLCRPFLLLPSIFPSIRVFSNELVRCIRWPKY